MPSETSPNNVDAEILHDCQRAISYQFSDVTLLRSALTHTSGANTRQASNERLEFLGDAVLGIVTVAHLFRRFPELQEGDLTKIKSAVVSRRTCARFTRDLGLTDYLFMGKNMQMSANFPASVQADVYEAIVGAIFLDGGLEAAQTFIMKHLEPEIESVAESTHGGNFKSLLQQVAQRKLGGTPQYVVLDEKGPDHSKCFKVAATVGRHTFLGAWGRNKKEAEQKAAMNALAEIEGDEPPYPSD